MADSVNHRRIFADICNGYTISSWRDSPLYIKHFSHFDQTDLDQEREKYFNVAKERGIPSLVEKMEWLSENQLWTKQKELDLIKYKSYLDNLQLSRKQAVASIQIKDMDRQIQEAKDKYNEMDSEKRNLINYTCETYVEEKIQSYYIYNGFYKDKSFSQKRFEFEEFEQLEDEDLNELMTIYIKFLQGYTSDVIKKISVSNFFASYFYLIDDVTKFFGKPMAFLTFHQVNLISYGQYYKHLMRTHGENMPKEIAEDPDAIEDYINRADNVKKVLAKTAGNVNGGVGVIGATKNDMKGVKAGPGSSIMQKSLEMGGINSIRDAIMLSG